MTNREFVEKKTGLTDKNDVDAILKSMREFMNYDNYTQDEFNELKVPSLRMSIMNHDADPSCVDQYDYSDTFFGKL